MPAQQKKFLALLLAVISLFGLISFRYKDYSIELPDVKSSHSASDDLGPSVSAQVTKIVDGDTIEVELDGAAYKVRMIGVDTPESVDPRKPVQCFALEATAKTKDLVENQTVTLIEDYSQDSLDKYGRLLRYVFLPDGTNVNLLLIKEGFAFEYTYDVPYHFQADFQAAQDFAEENQFGLWNPTNCAQED